MDFRFPVFDFRFQISVNICKIRQTTSSARITSPEFTKESSLIRGVAGSHGQNNVRASTRVKCSIAKAAALQLVHSHSDRV